MQQRVKICFQSKASLNYFLIGIHDKNHTGKPGIFVPHCTAALWPWQEIIFQHLGNRFCKLELSFCSLVNMTRNWVSENLWKDRRDISLAIINNIKIIDNIYLTLLLSLLC